MVVLIVESERHVNGRRHSGSGRGDLRRNGGDGGFFDASGGGRRGSDVAGHVQVIGPRCHPRPDHRRCRYTAQHPCRSLAHRAYRPSAKAAAARHQISKGPQIGSVDGQNGASRRHGELRREGLDDRGRIECEVDCRDSVAGA